MLIDRLKRIKVLCDLARAEVEGMTTEEAVLRISEIVDGILDSKFIGDYAKVDDSHKPKVNQKQVEALKGGKP